MLPTSICTSNECVTIGADAEGFEAVGDWRPALAAAVVVGIAFVEEALQVELRSIEGLEVADSTGTGNIEDPPEAGA